MQSHHAVVIQVDDVSQYDDSTHDSDAVECVKYHWSQLGVDEARSLSSSAFLMPATAAEQLFIVKTSFITHEAQNALLKLFEEPPLTSRFVLIIPRDLQLLPTLRSRMHAVSVAGEALPDVVFETFLSQSYADRLAHVEASAKTKDVDWQRTIKQSLITALASRAIQLDGAAYTRLQLVVERLLTRGASNKMLLEELALSLPIRD